MNFRADSTPTPARLPRSAVLLAVGLAASAMTTSSSPGAIQVFTSRAAFNAVAGLLGPISTEGYESYAIGLGGPRTIQLNGFNVSHDLANDIFENDFGIDDNSNPNVPGGIFSTAGEKFLRADYPTQGGPPTATTTFGFSTPIVAFGTDLRDVENILTFLVSTGESGLAGFIAPSSAIQFIGIVSDQSFTSIGFTQSRFGGGDTVVYDETSYVPAPSAAVIVMLGLTVMRRRRN